jgi:hypothetical protein
VSTEIEDGVATEEEARMKLRLKWQRQKQRQRERAEEVRGRVADKRGSATVPAVPEGLKATRTWLRLVHDLYSARRVTSQELQECRRTAQSIGDLHRVGADLRKAEAALRSAAAAEQMAQTLARVEHGEAAILMLERLREGVTTDGPRRPLPRPRAATMIPMVEVAES